MRSYLALCGIGMFWCLTAAGCATTNATDSDAAVAEAESATVRAFIERVELSRQQMPQIIAAAEAAAAHKVARPDTLLNVPYHTQSSFAEDILNRSGGLAGALPTVERSRLATDHDIVIFSIRSWDTQAEKVRKYFKEWREKGWTIILFASRAGMPDDIDVDFLIDNGAATGGADESPVNLLANITNVWLWVLEYSAALTRHGKHPGILQSITTAGSKANNAIYQKHATRHNIYPCETHVPAGDLARIYLDRVERLTEDATSEKTAGELEHAADIIAERLNTGRKVIVATNTHVMLNELGKVDKTPWEVVVMLRNISDVLPEVTEPGDLVVWVAYNGVSIWWYPADGGSATFIEYDKHFRKSGVDLITLSATDPLHPDNNGDYAIAHIEQNWDYGDSTVMVPFPPGIMAPVSGLYQCLLYRMLDDHVAVRLDPKVVAAHSDD